MRIGKTILSAVMIISILLSLAVPVAAGEAEDIQRQLLQYYIHHQERAETDILRLLQQLEAIDPEQAEDWAAIMSAWSGACHDLAVNLGILPDGLPEDESLCILVMGFALNYNGSMSEELLGRVRTALACAEKYPNAYILCTGGGTARGNYSVTEAGQMAAWLQEQGIPEERIIVENRSYSTELNVRYSMEILSQSYPQIRSLAVVSSDYHIRRCHWLFQAEIILQGLENVYQVVSNAAYEAGYEGESGYWFEAQSLSNLQKLGIRQTVAPNLSKLTKIAVTGETAYFPGELPELTVSAYYDSGFSRDVTQKAEIHGFDSTIPGETEIEITYTENGILQTATFPVTVLAPPTEAPTEPTMETQSAPTLPPESVPITTTTPPDQRNTFPLWIIAAVVPVLFLLPLALGKRKRGKYQK